MHTMTHAAVLLRADLTSLDTLSASLREAELTSTEALRVADALAVLAARERSLPLLVFASMVGAALAEDDATSLASARARVADALADFVAMLNRNLVSA